MPKKLGELGRCSEQVVTYSGMQSFFNQCSRNAKVRRENKGYCNQHDPVAVKRRNDAQSRKFDQEYEADLRREKLEAGAPALRDELAKLLAHIDAGRGGNLGPDDLAGARRILRKVGHPKVREREQEERE